MQNISLSVTHSDNKINVKHNNRDFEEREWGHTTNSHINRDLSKYNTSFIQQDIKEAYQEAFGEALAEYNEKQKRKYLKIPDYYEYIKGLNDQHKTKESKGGKATTKYNLQDEIIITIGNKAYWDDMHYRTISSINDKEEAERIFIEYKKKQSDEIFREFLKDFQAKHKHLHVFNAIAHYDEAGAPHMHLTFFGKAEGLKKGLRLQPRTTRAVAQDLDGDFYQKMLESDQKKYDLAKENLERKKQGLKPLQGDRKGDMSASANVYKQFLMETKQILIDKARELGLEYQATGTHDFGADMDEFKETMKKREEAIDKEVDKYKQQKQAEIKQLDAEIKDKKGEAQEAGKTAKQAKEQAKQAIEKRDELSREERIAKQNAENAKEQADNFKANLERVKAELNEQKKELAEITEKIVDQNLELEEAKEEKALIEADKNFLREQVQGNLSKISEQSAKISEQENQIRENEAKISKNKAFMEQQTKQHEEQIDFLARRTKALQEIEQVSKVSYSDKNVVKAFGTVTIGQDHYENLKKKAGLFESIKRFANNLVSTIKETSVYKEMKATLQAEIEHWKGLFNAEKAKNADLEKEKSVLKADNDKLRHDLGEMAYQRAEGKSLGWQIKEYFSEEEQKELEKEIAVRAKEREEEDKQLERDGFSYDR
ncbi:hypothetical protein [Streptococcus mitis]|uniref:hypothetical protein n=1 Tax=Streptococcus mitis TaxID=28037 RepID=UPI0021B64B1A|nr:hypothetical protein [Streptococcus mitis]